MNGQQIVKSLSCLYTRYEDDNNVYYYWYISQKPAVKQAFELMSIVRGDLCGIILGILW